jgi:septal ring factor EnvC (AmiA/AmiB activator)
MAEKAEVEVKADPVRDALDLGKVSLETIITEAESKSAAVRAQLDDLQVQADALGQQMGALREQISELEGGDVVRARSTKGLIEALQNDTFDPRMLAQIFRRVR